MDTTPRLLRQREPRRARRSERTTRTLQQRNLLLAALGSGVLAVGFDRLHSWAQVHGHKRTEALSDGGAHIATALTVSLPAANHVANPKRFVATAAISAVAIDLDHVVAARSVALLSCMSMPHRPPSHSVITIGASTYVAERIWPGSQSALALLLGLGSHLLRDLATGGAPLFLPKRILELPRPPVTTLMVGLSTFGTWYARRQLDPQRRRRSNPDMLAPEAVAVSSRALRAVRQLRRAA